MKDILKQLLLLLSLGLLIGCQTINHSTVRHDCIERANGRSALPPCWLNNTNKVGKSAEANKAIGSNGWTKARQSAYQQAILEFAQERYGQEVKINSVVNKKIISTTGSGEQSETLNKKVQVITHAEFNQGTNKINVKAKLIDYYYHPQTEKVYVWVQEVQPSSTQFNP